MYKNLALLLAITVPATYAMPASSSAFTATHDNGRSTGCKASLIGNPGYHFTTCHRIEPAGYYTTVMKDDGHIYYGELDANGRLVAGDVQVVTENDPIDNGVEMGQKESFKVMEQKCQENDYCKWKLDNNGMSGHNPPKGSYSNLVVPVVFSDHTNRDIDWTTLFDHLFEGENNSVKHYFQSQSHGKLSWDNSMADPVILPFTEAHCADGVSGTSSEMQTCLAKALDMVKEQGNTPDFDGVTFVHSGYGAEWGNRDEDHKYFHDRIWSHSWEVKTDEYSGRYALTSAHFGAHKMNMRQKLGAAVHEIAQMLGAPTQYGPEPGNGLGSYDMMANPFGFDGDLRNPGSMSAYTKMLLEFAEVVEIDESGTYTIESSQNSAKVYKISKDFAFEDEYYLIENRAHAGYDMGLDGPGLAIYHVDGTANGIPGYPEDPNNYPTNHYKVSLIQADGRYDLEMEEDQGDQTDLFHNGGVDGLTPSGTLKNGVPHMDFPNTDAYSNGNLAGTGLSITEISQPGEVMTFKVTFGTATTTGR